MKYLISKDGSFYKANLHSHSTGSDGLYTPEQLKERYMAMGYSIFAYTDHFRLLPRDYLTDDNFLALNGLELGLSSNPDKNSPTFQSRKNCDIGLIAPKGVTVPYDFKESVKIFNNSNPDNPETVPDPNYNPRTVCDIMKNFRDRGFFVTHNHPAWSLERYEDYKHFHGMHALEIMNYGCIVGGVFEHNDHVYQQMLELGERIYCIAGDDNHNPKGKKIDDSFGAWTMIKAKSLTYEAVMDALFSGNFYATEGPEIHELYVDDYYVLHVVTSPVKYIRISSADRTRKLIRDEKGGLVTEATMQLNPHQKFVRVTISDEKGKFAYSNAYFMDEIFG